MKGLLSILAVLLSAGAAFLVLGGAPTPTPPVGQNTSPEPAAAGPRDLTGETKPQVVAEPGATTAPAVRPENPGSGAGSARALPPSAEERIAAESLEAALNPDEPVAQRLEHAKDYKKRALTFLPEEEVGHRLAVLLRKEHDYSDAGTLHAGVLRLMQDLNAEAQIPTILEMTRDRRSGVRIGALEALMQKRNDTAIRSRIETMRRDRDPLVRKKAEELLDQ